MYEAKERQKFINDAQYLREMQHKMDSEYQACLRKQEQTKEQSEKKREQHARQELRQTNTSSISAVRTYERPWISRLPINRQPSSDESSGCELKSAIKSIGNKSEAKFPAIDKTSVKQKQKSNTSSKKPEKSGPGPKKDSSAFQKPILSRRRMNQRSLLENTDTESIRRVEARGRKTPVLQGIAKITKGSDSSHPSLFRANFTAHLRMAGPLPDQVPIFLTVSDLRNQTSFVSSTTVCSSPSTKEINKPETDPEKLKKLQESLLAEDSEEEGDQCRICQIAGGSITNPLLEPCGCGGTLRFVHQECLKTWLKAKIKSGAELGAVKTCELCKQSLTVDLDDFNVNDYYRNHQQSRAQDELMNSGLYLVLLLHLYEQRFAELMRLNYNQASRDRLSRQPRTEENQRYFSSCTTCMGRGILTTCCVNKDCSFTSSQEEIKASQ
ncbi:probable E3 ubiquitin-protein ligase MARCHF10 isoform X3 [Rhineura floridana]|uniref:probable E3 ubiquitin-protein ligase MARCHF10 isoform X3 n=1 Tax=Rhineura floridana TaxID=261503 RepID=UPI002AC82BDA|nr:probable E3 ubiquitin-protein ligase MARCHF10 isoform X3 [Rhineura floridana]